ncbi:1629_t:CDS:1, partial [Dentiscutata erythropus]
VTIFINDARVLQPNTRTQSCTVDQDIKRNNDRSRAELFGNHQGVQQDVDKDFERTY